MITRSNISSLPPPKFFTTCLMSNEFLEPKNIVKALNKLYWFQAMKNEFVAPQKNHICKLIPLQRNMNVVDHKQVFKRKLKVDDSLQKFQVRLVAKGFRKMPNINYIHFNPVEKLVIMRIIFTSIVSYNWPIHYVNINNVFLNRVLKEEVYMTQPRGFIDLEKPNHMCKLVKALYGLKQALRVWYKKLRNVLVLKRFKNPYQIPVYLYT